MRVEFEKEWEKRYGKNTVANLCTSENLPPGKYASLHFAAGAVLSSGFISADLSPQTYISPTAWKSVCIQLGCYDKDPKGIEALKQINWGFRMPGTDDEADAIIIYLSWRFYQQKVLWFSEKQYVHSWYMPKKKKSVKNAKNKN